VAEVKQLYKFQWTNKAARLYWTGLDWAVFNVSTNTV